MKSTGQGERYKRVEKPSHTTRRKIPARRLHGDGGGRKISSIDMELGRSVASLDMETDVLDV